MIRVSEILSQVDTLKVYLTLEPYMEGFPQTKTIYNDPHFIEWREQAIYALESLKQIPAVTSTIKLLKGFNGWNDESNFETLQAKIKVLLENISDLQMGENMEKSYTPSHLSKGCTVHTAFDDYTINSQIGSGGNGRVFAAVNSSDSQVAVKFVPQDVSVIKRKRFKNEIFFCENSGNENVIKILDHGFAEFEDGKYSFYVMPLYQKTLRDKIKEGLSSEQAVSIFIGLMKGLQYAHKNGTIHRDIKPENILFATDSFTPIICDFGIAHFSEENLLTAVETKATERLANFQYAAPEQKQRGGAVGVTTDIYAAGLILNEMFTGEIPQAAQYKTIASVAPDFDYLDNLFSRIYCQNPADRIPSAEAVLTDLKLLSKKKESSSTVDSLQKAIDGMHEPSKVELSVNGVSFSDGQLIFSMSEFMPCGWFQILQTGSYSHSSVMGFGPERLQYVDDYSISLPLREISSSDTIKTIVQYFKQWTVTANLLYNKMQKQRVQEEQQEIELRRQEELKKIEQADRINAILAQI